MIAEKLVFLDESGVNINMTRQYGRAKGKERVCDDLPFHTPKKHYATFVYEIKWFSCIQLF